MVRPETCLAEQLIVRSVAQVSERRCIGRVVPKASGTVLHFVDALTLRRLGEAMPCAGGVRDASDDSRTVNVLQSGSIQSMAALHSEGVMRLRTGHHESLDVLCDREIVSNNYAQHLHTASLSLSLCECKLSQGSSRYLAK